LLLCFASLCTFSKQEGKKILKPLKNHIYIIFNYFFKKVHEIWMLFSANLALLAFFYPKGKRKKKTHYVKEKGLSVDPSPSKVIDPSPSKVPS
jgi:hypothetical protein